VWYTVAPSCKKYYDLTTWQLCALLYASRRTGKQSTDTLHYMLEVWLTLIYSRKTPYAGVAEHCIDSRYPGSTIRIISPPRILSHRRDKEQNVIFARSPDKNVGQLRNSERFIHRFGALRRNVWEVSVWHGRRVKNFDGCCRRRRLRGHICR
jgi:hypothetical protein